MAATAAPPPSTQPLRDPDAMDVDSEGPVGGQPSVGSSTPKSESVTTPTTPEPVTASQSPIPGTPTGASSGVPEGAKAPSSAKPASTSTPAAEQKPPPAAGSKSEPSKPETSSATATAEPTAKSADKGKAPEKAPEPTPAPVEDKGPVPELKDLVDRERAIGGGLDGASLTVSELQDALSRALSLKEAGNKAFVVKPHTAKTLSEAEADYSRALGALPTVPKHLPMPTLQDLAEKERIVEISDEEADLIERDAAAGPARCAADNAINDAKKVLWANLGAVFVAQHRYPDAVAACTRALNFDPTYQKALLRRAAASEQIGDWTALTNAQRDYIALMGMLPAAPMPGSADAQNLKQVEQGLKTLPAKIRAAKDKGTNDAVNKLGKSSIS